VRGSGWYLVAIVAMFAVAVAGLMIGTGTVSVGGH
jgi:hypothetical protein